MAAGRCETSSLKAAREKLAEFDFNWEHPKFMQNQIPRPVWDVLPL